ncbi:hypothetical protein ACIQBJ_03495 [Kitasatospora sp. NPDC088391]|uniref:hypothetical protein n=1 Tax=Kitasatospora sp. NPDC088391 TaxID=3364074 RepID=UPI0038042CA4
MGTPEQLAEAERLSPGPAQDVQRAAADGRPERGPHARRVADRLSVRFRVPIEPQYDPAGRRWTLRWYDGPTVAAVRCALERPGPDGAGFAVRRDLSTRALALAAIRETRAGAMHRAEGSWGQRYHLEQLLTDREHPDRPVDPREAAMLERLLSAAGAGAGRGSSAPDLALAFDLVARHGVAWLLPGHRLAGPADRDASALSPLEYLTSRYATGVHRTAWETALAVLPVRTAVAAAHRDRCPDPDAARAALTLLPALRAEVAAELDAMRDRLAAAAAGPPAGPATESATDPAAGPDRVS